MHCRSEGEGMSVEIQVKGWGDRVAECDSCAILCNMFGSGVTRVSENIYARENVISWKKLIRLSSGFLRHPHVHSGCNLWSYPWPG